MSRDPVRAGTQFFGGRVCLDFANTLDWRTSDRPQELVPDYPALLEWSRRRGTLPDRAIARLYERCAREAAAAQAVVAGAHSVRAELWRTSDALRSGKAADLAVINRALSTLPPQPRLVTLRDGYVHDLPGRDFREPLWPVFWSLTAVLASDDATRLGCCQAEGCGWFFVDESPNRTRLWCSSEVCGNRERARRAYAKRRSARARVDGSAVTRFRSFK
jgi:predicted RNA-binding Zn ribbon-like protein